MRAPNPLAGAALVLLAALTVPARSEEPPCRRSVAFGGLAGQDFIPNSNGFSEFAGAFADVGMFVSHKLELGLDMHPVMLIRQPENYRGEGDRQTVPAAALEVVLRWLPGPSPLGAPWYLELMEGPFWSWHRVPAGGTRFNFMTQVGTGFLVPSGKDWSVLVGYRLIHISNANLSVHNPSWNYHALILGVRHEIFPGQATPAGGR